MDQGAQNGIAVDGLPILIHLLVDGSAPEGLETGSGPDRGSGHHYHSGKAGSDAILGCLFAETGRTLEEGGTCDACAACAVACLRAPIARTRTVCRPPQRPRRGTDNACAGRLGERYEPDRPHRLVILPTAGPPCARSADRQSPFDKPSRPLVRTATHGEPGYAVEGNPTSWQGAPTGPGTSCVRGGRCAKSMAPTISPRPDWHLPDSKALQGIVDHDRTSIPAIDDIFGTTQNSGTLDFPTSKTSDDTESHADVHRLRARARA